MNLHAYYISSQVCYSSRIKKFDSNKFFLVTKLIKITFASFKVLSQIRHIIDDSKTANILDR